MHEHYITYLEKQARLELEKARIELEKARLYYRAVIIGEILFTLAIIIFVLRFRG